MFPSGLARRGLGEDRSLATLFEPLAEHEAAVFGPPPRGIDPAELRRRTTLCDWSGEEIAPASRIGEVPDPGVVLCLVYDAKGAEATLPAPVFAQTLRRFALRDPALRARFEQHVAEAGTFVPPWLSPEVHRQKSQEAFDRAMKVAREQGFAVAAPLFEGVRGECFARAQLAIALYELRDLGDLEAALARLGEVVRVAPRDVAARMQRANILLRDPGRKVEASTDYLAVLRELARQDGEGASAAAPGPESRVAPRASNGVRDAALEGLWALHAEFADPVQLEAAVALARQDAERGFEALSRYVHTHPCAWDAQTKLAALALTRQRFDLTIKLLSGVRWLFPDDPNPHFFYGQALAKKGSTEGALAALEHALRLSPGDADVRKWLTFVQKQLSEEQADDHTAESVAITHHLVRSLLLIVGFVRGGQVQPSAVALHRIPGDVSLALVVQALAAHEQRRFGPSSSAPPAATSNTELQRVAERSALLDYAGERLTIDNTIGDVPDPGVIVALLYETAARDATGRLALSPPPAECRRILLEQAGRDGDIAAKLEKHLASPEARLLARLDLGA